MESGTRSESAPRPRDEGLRLAEAYGGDLDVPTGGDEGSSDDGVVVSLRRHLEAQKAILDDAA